MVEQILNDSEIVAIYHEIEKMEVETGGWAYHNLTHVKNVANLMEQLLRHLNQDEFFIEEVKVAALLHDIGSLDGKADHAQRSYEYAKNYFKHHRLNLRHEKLILDAIKEHSNGFECNNLMTLVLILADKLDITNQRLAPAGYQIDGLNEIQYIDSIDVSIINGALYVHFITQPDFNKESFEKFYFSKKVFQAIKSFSTKLNLNYHVKLNQRAWDIK